MKERLLRIHSLLRFGTKGDILPEGDKVTDISSNLSVRKPRPSPTGTCWGLFLGLRCNLKRFGCLWHRLQEWLALLIADILTCVNVKRHVCYLKTTRYAGCGGEEDLWQLMPFAFFGDTVILPSVAVLSDVLTLTLTLTLAHKGRGLRPSPNPRTIACSCLLKAKPLT